MLGGLNLVPFRFGPLFCLLVGKINNMRTLEQVLDEMDRADMFFGVKMDSVRVERFSGETALHIFAKWGDSEAVRILVSNGANINKPGEDMNTPLHYAAMGGQFETVKCLVQLGAKNLKDRYGNCARKLAMGHDTIEKYLEENGF